MRSERITVYYRLSGTQAEVSAPSMDGLRNIIRGLEREHVPYRAVREIRDGSDAWTLTLSREQVMAMLRDAMRKEHVYVAQDGRILAFGKEE